MTALITLLLLLPLIIHGVVFEYDPPNGDISAITVNKDGSVLTVSETDKEALTDDVETGELITMASFTSADVEVTLYSADASYYTVYEAYIALKTPCTDDTAVINIEYQSVDGMSDQTFTPDIDEDGDFIKISADIDGSGLEFGNGAMFVFSFSDVTCEDVTYLNEIVIVGEKTLLPPCSDGWSVEYMGKSTQFKLYDVCSDTFIKVKMDDLIEYDDAGKATKNKETSFKSSKDWLPGNPNAEFQGNDVLYNVFEADDLIKDGAEFILETYFFLQESTIDDPNHNDPGTVPPQITINANSLKFNVLIEGWGMDEVTNYLKLCISIMTNAEGSSTPEFAVTSPTVATCGGTVESEFVEVDTSGNGNNQMDICYTFKSCDGDIDYDPLLQISEITDNSNANSRNIFIAVMVSIVSLFV